MSKVTIVAIDGPAGSGKSTVSKQVAKNLGLLRIDTGAMYRALTLKALDKKISLQDGRQLEKLAKSTKIDLKPSRSGPVKVLLDGESVTKQIRTPRVTTSVKFVAKVAGVRRCMVELQRKMAERDGAVLEGRDIGTVVFPHTKNKFYLDACIEERIDRRYKELIQMGMNVSRPEIKKDVILRDRTDKVRKVAPLKRAKDAVYIDTTDMTVEEVAGEIVRRVKDKCSMV